MNRLSTLYLSGLLACLVFPSSAFAYLDPGSSSLLLQLLFSGVTGILIICKMYWKNFKILLGRSSKRSVSDRSAGTD